MNTGISRNKIEPVSFLMYAGHIEIVGNCR